MTTEMTQPRGIKITAKPDGNIGLTPPKARTISGDALATVRRFKPQIHRIVSVFGDTGVSLISLKTPLLRKRMEALVRWAERVGDRDLAVAIRDCFEERLAICTIAGRLDEDAAEAVALVEVEQLPAPILDYAHSMD